MSQVKSFFDNHGDHYTLDPQYYDSIIQYLKKLRPEGKLKIFDFGCGNGNFLKGMVESGIVGEFYGSDISSTMIKFAKKNLQNKNVHLFVANIFYLPVNSQVKFDLINLDYVLHHLIGKYRFQSFDLADKAMKILEKMVSKNGIIYVEEVTYDSYIFPNLTSWLIFYGLKIANFLKFDLGKFQNEIVSGLEVNFFHKKQLKKFLKQFGEIREIRNTTWTPKGLRRIFLLKKEGRICYAIKPTKNNKTN